MLRSTLARILSRASFVLLCTCTVASTTAAGPYDEAAYAAARSKVESARAEEQAARDAFESARERLAGARFEGPENRSGKVRQDRFNETLDARSAWDKATARLHEAEDALDAAGASRSETRSTPEGRRLSSHAADGWRAVALGDAAIAGCDRVEFERARRRATRAIQRLAQLADRWGGEAAGTQRAEWGDAARDAMNGIATAWNAVEAQWHAHCGGGQAGRHQDAAPGAGDPDDPQSPAPGDPLAQDVACPGLGGDSQLAFLSNLDARAKAQFGDAKQDTAAMRTVIGENERVVLFGLQRARLYDLAGQIALWNQHLRGTGEVEEGSAVEAAADETLPEFVEAQLSGEGGKAGGVARGQKSSPAFEKRRASLVDGLTEQAAAYGERVDARDAAQRDVDAAHAAVESALREADEPFRTSERRDRLRSDPEFAALSEAENQATQILDEAHADVQAADDVVARNPILSKRIEGRRLIDILRDPGVGDATKQEYVDVAIRRHVESLWNEFQRVAGFSSFSEVADLLHPTFAPLQAYTEQVLARFCFKRAGIVMGQLQQTWKVSANLDRLDEEGEDVLFAGVGTGLLVLTALGATALTAGGASPLVMGTFLAGMGSVDFAVSVEEYAAVDARVQQAEETFAQRQQSAMLGAKSDATALAEDERQLARNRTTRMWSAIGVGLTGVGAMGDVTEASVRGYRALASLGEAADATAQAARAEAGASAAASTRTATAGGNTASTAARAETPTGAAGLSPTEVSRSEAPTQAPGLSRTEVSRSEAPTQAPELSRTEVSRSEAATAGGAASGAFVSPAAARTAQAIQSFPAGVRPAVGEIGPLPAEVEQALKTISENPIAFNSFARGGEGTPALRQATQTILGFKPVVEGVPVGLESGVAAGAFGVVFRTSEGRALRFASSKHGVDKAVEAATDALEAASALATARIPGVGFPAIHFVGTQAGRPRFFVSEFVPADQLGQTPEQIVDTLWGLTGARLVFYDAADRNLYSGGILDLDLLGMPTLDEATRLGRRLAQHVAQPDLRRMKYNNFSPVLGPLAQSVREAAMLEPAIVNLAMLGHLRVFRLGTETVNGKVRFFFLRGSVSLEYLAEHFPYFAEFRRAVEALEPGQRLEVLPGTARIATSGAGARPAVVHLVPTTSTAGKGGRGAAVRAIAQLVGSGIGPFGFLTTLAPLGWSSVGAPVVVPEEAGGGVLVPVYTSELQKLAELLVDAPGVAAVEPDKRLRAEIAAPDDPYFHSRGSWGQAYADQWALQRVGFGADGETPWEAAGEPRERVLVAVLDSGLDRAHPDLAPDSLWRNPREQTNGRDDDGNGYVDDALGWDFVDGDPDPEDVLGHGTHVAGVIAAATGNGLGIAGASPHARILPLRILDEVGSGRASRLAAAIFYAVAQGARVINLSVGGETISYTERLAIDYAVQAGALVVVAAGNRAADASAYGPAGLESALTVVATGPDDERAGFSNFGDAVDLAAPGVDILSLRARGTDLAALLATGDPSESGGVVGDDGLYYRASGTSFAAPFVSGAASLLLGARPSLSRAQVEAALLMSARDVGVPGTDRLTGFGRLDTARALAADPDWLLIVRVSSVGVIATPAGETAIEVRGSAHGSAFREYTLELGQGRTPEAWREIARHRSPVRDGLLGRVPLEAITQTGAWTVRVVASDPRGERREARGSLDVQ